MPYITYIDREPPMTQRYEILITNFDGSETVLYHERPKCKTSKGRDRQHNSVVNKCVEALRDLPGGFWTRLTVTIVPHVTPEEVAQYPWNVA